MWFPGGPAGAGPVLSTAIAAGLTVFVQTTVLLALGLFVSVAMRRQGPVAQSYVLRMVLVLVIASTTATIFGLYDRAIMVPVPSLPVRSAGSVPDDGIRPVDAESPLSPVPLNDGNVTAVSPPV